MNSLASKKVDLHEYYLCSTPYHVLVSHLVAEQRGVGARTLLLTRVAAQQEHNRIIAPSFWQRVVTIDTPGTKRLPSAAERVHIARLAKSFGAQDRGGRVMFWGNDVEPFYQLIRSALAPTHTFLFEDGIGSYTGHNFTHSALKTIMRTVIYRTILGKSYSNSKGLSRSPASGYYALHPSAFPAVADRKSVICLSLQNSSYVRFLKAKFAPVWNSNTDIAIWVSQPLVEDSLLSVNEEIELLSGVASFCTAQGIQSISIKPHPSENPESVGRKAAVFKNLGLNVVVLSHDLPPLEVMLLTGAPVKIILGVTSTTLGNARILAPQIRSVSAFKCLSPKVQSALNDYHRILAAFGVEFL